MTQQQVAERQRRKIERELKHIAFANAADYVEVMDEPDEAGRWVRVVATARLKATSLCAIAAIKESKNGVEIKLKDSIKALELLCKLYGLPGAEKKQGGQDSLSELLEGLKELNEPDGVQPDDEEEENDLQ